MFFCCSLKRRFHPCCGDYCEYKINHRHLSRWKDGWKIVENQHNIGVSGKGRPYMIRSCFKFVVRKKKKVCSNFQAVFGAFCISQHDG